MYAFSLIFLDLFFLLLTAAKVFLGYNTQSHGEVIIPHHNCHQTKIQSNFNIQCVRDLNTSLTWFNFAYVIYGLT